MCAAKSLCELCVAFCHVLCCLLFYCRNNSCSAAASSPPKKFQGQVTLFNGETFSRWVHRFVQDADAVRKLRKSFAGLWGLDDEGESEIFNQAISKPEGFVLKPQREGGGEYFFLSSSWII